MAESLSSLSYRATWVKMTPEELAAAGRCDAPGVINEVSAANDIYINDYQKREDWIELYNTGTTTVDLSGYGLSDRLTSWQTIETRLRAAAEGDFCIVLYNPASRSRKDHLKKACDILMEKIENTRICGIVRNAGRDGEQASILTLEELKNTQADMFCTVFIGNSKTRKICANMVTPRGYLEK